jgi:hypothetical protein
MPVFNIFAKDDHIIPPCSQALGGHGLGGLARSLPGGHGRVRQRQVAGVLGTGIVDWLRKRPQPCPTGRR